MAICLLFVFIAGFAGTYVQFLKGELLDAALEGISAGVFRIAIAFFAAIAVEMASFYGYNYFRGRFSVENKKSLRSLYFDWLLMRSPVEAMTVQQGEFVAQYTDQIDQVNESYLDNILQKSSALVIATWNTEEYDAGNRKGKTCYAFFPLKYRLHSI